MEPVVTKKPYTRPASETVTVAIEQNFASDRTTEKIVNSTQEYDWDQSL